MPSVMIVIAMLHNLAGGVLGRLQGCFGQDVVISQSPRLMPIICAGLVPSLALPPGQDCFPSRRLLQFWVEIVKNIWLPLTGVRRAGSIHWLRGIRKLVADWTFAPIRN